MRATASRVADVTAYRVTGAYATAKVADSEGEVGIRGFMQDAVLPSGTTQESIDHLLSVNLIEAVDSAPVVEPTEEELAAKAEADAKIAAEAQAATDKAEAEAKAAEAAAAKGSKA